MTRPLLLVTASVDKMVLKKSISVDIDLKISGAVIWVGRSSIEIQLEVTQLTNGMLLRIILNSTLYVKIVFYIEWSV